MMICPNCSKEIPDNANVCGYCGTKIKKFQPCPSCGKEVPATAKVCGYCGTRLVEQQPTKSDVKIEKEEEQPSVQEKTAFEQAQSPQIAELPKETRVKNVKKVKKSAKSAKTKPSDKKLPKWVLPLAAGIICVAVIAFFLFNYFGNSASLDFLAGYWSGNVENDGYYFEYRMWFYPDCKLNHLCGSFEIPEFSCTGDVTIYKVSGNKYYFRVSNTSDGCGGASYEEYLQYLEPKSMRIHSEGEYGITKGILNKR